MKRTNLNNIGDKMKAKTVSGVEIPAHFTVRDILRERDHNAKMGAVESLERLLKVAKVELGKTRPDVIFDAECALSVLRAKL